MEFLGTANMNGSQKNSESDRPQFYGTSEAEGLLTKRSQTHLRRHVPISDGSGQTSPAVAEPSAVAVASQS